MFSALISSFLLTGTPVQVGQPQLTSSSVRLAVTPVLDGRMTSEEWDPLGESGGQPVFFQWDDNAVYWAAETDGAQDMILSLDYSGDGWLNGDDNYEIRVSVAGGIPKTAIRRLDASDKNGPQWRPGGLAPSSVMASAKPTADGYVIEASYQPPSNMKPEAGSRLGVRVDVAEPNDDLGAPFVPRSMGFLILQLDSSSGLEENESWRPRVRNRSIAREDEFGIEYEIRRDDDSVDFESFAYRAEGDLKANLAEGRQPFAPFKGKSMKVGFKSIVAESATPGWRVVRAELTRADGSVAILRSSIRVSEFLDFDVRLPDTIKAQADAQVVKGSVTLKSQVMGQLEGMFTAEAPNEWTLSKGATDEILIYHARGTKKVNIEMIVPKNTYGVFPLKFSVKVGEKTVEHTLFLTVE
jgi:hypothetical protein